MIGMIFLNAETQRRREKILFDFCKTGQSRISKSKCWFSIIRIVNIILEFKLKLRLTLKLTPLLCLLFSCSSQQILTKKERKTLHAQIVDSPIFSKSHTGFALYDPVKKDMLYEYDSDKLFTPASNTKIFTLYAALKILGDTIPALQYVTTGDSLIFWGTGDPSLWLVGLGMIIHIAIKLKNLLCLFMEIAFRFKSPKWLIAWRLFLPIFPLIQTLARIIDVQVHALNGINFKIKYNY